MWRCGGLADAPLAARLAAEAFDPEYREAWTSGQIAGLLHEGGAWLQFAETPDAGAIAFALCRKAADEVELLLCATSAGFRRQGLGVELIRRVAEQARILGGGRLFLEVRASNIAALELYRKAGFSEDGRRPGYYRSLSGRAIDAISLSLQL